MIPSASPLRYERKFIPRGCTLAQALAIVHRHPALFRKAYPSRSINNIYFDTPGMGDYRDHVVGAANRIKTRVRWYGPLYGPVEHPVLEKKTKRGLLGEKQGYALPPFTFRAEMHPRDLQNLFDGAEMPDAVREGMRHRHPTLVNRYHRHYFLSADRLFRLTVDTEMEFHRFYPPGKTPAVAFDQSVPSVIIELKYDLSNSDNAGQVTNALPFRMERCSKYVLGMQCTLPA